MKTFLIKNDWLASASHGWGNGYVIVPVGHPAHGKYYDEIDVDVHGGLTFAKSVNELIEDNSVFSDDDKDGWVFGFDTWHYRDNIDEWPEEKVQEETDRLKQQLIDMI